MKSWRNCFVVITEKGLSRSIRRIKNRGGYRSFDTCKSNCKTTMHANRNSSCSELCAKGYLNIRKLFCIFYFFSFFFRREAYHSSSPVRLEILLDAYLKINYLSILNSFTILNDWMDFLTRIKKRGRKYLDFFGQFLLKRYLS